MKKLLLVLLAVTALWAVKDYPRRHSPKETIRGVWTFTNYGIFAHSYKGIVGADSEYITKKYADLIIGSDFRSQIRDTVLVSTSDSTNKIDTTYGGFTTFITNAKNAVLAAIRDSVAVSVSDSSAKIDTTYSGLTTYITNIANAIKAVIRDSVGVSNAASADSSSKIDTTATGLTTYVTNVANAIKDIIRDTVAVSTAAIADSSSKIDTTATGFTTKLTNIANAVKAVMRDTVNATLIWGNRTCTNHTVDTVVVSGITTGSFLQLTWKGVGSPYTCLSYTLTTDTAFVRILAQDTSRARTAGYTYLLRK